MSASRMATLERGIRLAHSTLLIVYICKRAPSSGRYMLDTESRLALADAASANNR
jgi:hypothetical protein